jgi:hypothetical protein
MSLRGHDLLRGFFQRLLADDVPMRMRGAEALVFRLLRQADAESALSGDQSETTPRLLSMRGKTLSRFDLRCRVKNVRLLLPGRKWIAQTCARILNRRPTNA